MELQKHNDDLAKHIALLDLPSDSQLAKELMSLHEAKCKACQEDRLSCTVRPACKNRNFLNMLVELGVEPQDLPSFCYSVYQDQLSRYILDRKGRGVADKRLLIKDLLSKLKVSSIRHFNSRFKEEWKNFASVSDNNHMLVAGDDLLFHFDFVRGVVILNPSNHTITSYDVFRLFVEVLSESMRIKAEAKDITTNWWELHFNVINKKLDPEKIGSFKEKVRGPFRSPQASITNDGVDFRTDLVVDGTSNPIIVKNLIDIFKLVAELKSAS
ncbi:MAG: hypothetical protein P1Q69_05745 [Candidatus Thorarchaeota archaeon]|nr:hypothetical protein [Candidatus Thorarchaeota archaeon]